MYTQYCFITLTLYFLFFEGISCILLIKFEVCVHMLEFMLFQVVDQDVVDVVLEIFNSQSDTSKTKALEIEETSERAFEEVSVV